MDGQRKTSIRDEGSVARMTKRPMTNYERLFGSPRKAATFVTNMMQCSECPARKVCLGRRRFNCGESFAEYLREEVRDDARD